MMSHAFARAPLYLFKITRADFDKEASNDMKTVCVNPLWIYASSGSRTPFLTCVALLCTVASIVNISEVAVRVQI